MTILTVSKFGAPGFIRDVAEYAVEPQAFNEVRNVRFNSSGAQTFGGEVEVMSQAPFSPLWLKAFPPIASPLWVYANGQQVYAYDGNHNQITRVSGPYSGTPTERWHAEVLNGIGFFNNTVDVPQVWTDFDASQKLVDFAVWPASLRCKFLRPFKNFLFAGNLKRIAPSDGLPAGDYPFSIRWSDAAAPGTLPSSWALNDPTKLSGEQDIAATDDYLVDGMGLGNLFIVYKQKATYALYFVNVPNVFDGFDNQIVNKGILTRDCVQAHPKGHFVVGIDDIYIHNGSKGSEQSVVEAKLRNWVFNQIDATNFFYCYTFQITRRSEIIFAFPEAGETYPTLGLVWNWVTGGIGVRDLHKSPFIYPGPILVAVDDDIWGSEATIETFFLVTENGDVLITGLGEPILWTAGTVEVVIVDWVDLSAWPSFSNITVGTGFSFNLRSLLTDPVAPDAIITVHPDFTPNTGWALVGDSWTQTGLVASSGNIRFRVVQGIESRDSPILSYSSLALTIPDTVSTTVPTGVTALLVGTQVNLSADRFSDAFIPGQSQSGAKEIRWRRGATQIGVTAVPAYKTPQLALTQFGTFTPPTFGQVNRVYSLTSAGAAGFASTSDEGAFLYSPVQVTGDFVATVSIDSHSAAFSTVSHAGLMARSTLTPDSPFVQVYQAPDPTQGTRLRGRLLVGTGVTVNPVVSNAVPTKQKLVRIGNTLTGYYWNATTKQWISLSSLTLAGPVYLGLSLASRSQGNAITTVYSDFNYIATDTTSLTFVDPTPGTGTVSYTAVSVDVAGNISAASEAAVVAIAAPIDNTVITLLHYDDMQGAYDAGKTNQVGGSVKRWQIADNFAFGDPILDYSPLRARVGTKSARAELIFTTDATKTAWKHSSSTESPFRNEWNASNGAAWPVTGWNRQSVLFTPQNGIEYWSGYSIFLPAPGDSNGDPAYPLNTVHPSFCLVAQWHGAGEEGNDARNPMSAMFISGPDSVTGFKARWHLTSLSQKTFGSQEKVYDTNETYDLGPIAPDQGHWVDFVHRTRWDYGNLGIMQVWKNDLLVVNQLNHPNSFNNTSVGYPCPIGFYTERVNPAINPNVQQIAPGMPERIVGYWGWWKYIKLVGNPQAAVDTNNPGYLAVKPPGPRPL